jgi:diacylglycerol kinase (ATP)
MESPYKGKTGPQRLLNATRYSLAGLVEAARHEDAFRQELILAAVLVPRGLALGASGGESALRGGSGVLDRGVERALLVGSVLLVLVVELVNSAVEATVDRVSLDDHRLAKRAKDLGSAAVMLALATMGAVWLMVLAA